MTDFETALEKAALDLATKDAEAIFSDLRVVLNQRDMLHVQEDGHQSNTNLLTEIYSNCKTALQRRYSRKLAKGILDVAQATLKEKP